MKSHDEFAIQYSNVFHIFPYQEEVMRRLNEGGDHRVSPRFSFLLGLRMHVLCLMRFSSFKKDPEEWFFMVLLCAGVHGEMYRPTSRTVVQL